MEAVSTLKHFMLVFVCCHQTASHPLLFPALPQTDRKTPLGELNWIFTAITDTIAWNVLPKPLFQKLFRSVSCPFFSCTSEAIFGTLMRVCTLSFIWDGFH